MAVTVSSDSDVRSLFPSGVPMVVVVAMAVMLSRENAWPEESLVQPRGIGVGSVVGVAVFVGSGAGVTVSKTAAANSLVGVADVSGLTSMELKRLERNKRTAAAIMAMPPMPPQSHLLFQNGLAARRNSMACAIRREASL